jgi:hypothetical protein
MSPEHIRGAILANWQLADAAGIFFGFLCNLLIVIHVDPTVAWRVLTNTTLIPTIPLLVMIYLMPESPRYLMKHGAYGRALDAFNQIQTTPLLAARDFMYAHAQLDFESRMYPMKRASEFRSLAERIAVRAGKPSYEAPELSRDMSQASLRVGRGNQDQFELQNLQRRASNRSSPDIDLDIEEARTRAGKTGNLNPYSYHIGVTGYFQRLGQLWSNVRCRHALLAASTAMISQQVRHDFVGVFRMTRTDYFSKSLDDGSKHDRFLGDHLV